MSTNERVNASGFNFGANEYVKRSATHRGLHGADELLHRLGGALPHQAEHDDEHRPRAVHVVVETLTNLKQFMAQTLTAAVKRAAVQGTNAQKEAMRRRDDAPVSR